MISNFKLRQKPEQLKTKCIKHDVVRRVNTQANQTKYMQQNPAKRINLYQNRNPLTDNKMITNVQKKDLKTNMSNSSIKANRIKSILADERKSKQHIKLVKPIVTEPYEKSKAKISDKLVDKLFNKQKKNVTRQYKKDVPLKKQPVTGKDKYTFDEKIGSGTFGVVFKGRNKQTLETVAIKKVLQDKKYKNREHQILKLLDHPNVLKMKDAFFTQQNNQEYLNVIMDYFPDTVYSLIKRHTKKNIMPNIMIKLLSYQMFRSLLYLNKIDICHRDIKPHNILVDDTTNKLVMCDFGSAKKLVAGQSNIAYICSRCYRAPQLIFGATKYTTQIDMWSAGCVLIEMIICEPIFMASNNVDQLVEIIRVLGTPTIQDAMAMNPEYDMNQFRFPKINPREWKKIIKENLDTNLLDLISQIMRYNPKQRLTPFQALCHPYFDQLRDQRSYNRLKKEMQVPNLFNFTNKQCTQDQYYALVPQWYS